MSAPRPLRAAPNRTFEVLKDLMGAGEDFPQSTPNRTFEVLKERQCSMGTKPFGTPNRTFEVLKDGDRIQAPEPLQLLIAPLRY